MSPQPRLIRFTSRISLLALLAALGAVTWSTPAQARTPGGVIGVGYYDHQGPPPWVDTACKYTAVYKPCHCPPPTVANFDSAMGCSNESQAWADRDALNSCTNLCARAAKDSPGGGNGNNNGGVAGRPGGSTTGGISLGGAGTLAARESGGYVAFVPFSLEPIGHAEQKEQLAEALVEATSVPWVFLEGMGESIQWEDPKGSAAFVQAYWSDRGAPNPIGHCKHSLQVSCPLQDVKLGDSLQVCSGESDEDAQKIAETSCAPLRYDALSRSWNTWGVFGYHHEGPYRAPTATVLAVGPQQFLGFVPSSMEAMGPYEDWSKLADELLERTEGTSVWLAGPPKFYSAKE
ncbi:hypothetical protein FJV41_14335 [Myxococcus llanfairpwllgwyngyllgogerychwyrndrobwllllantysiliogogogochensis]|uniref:Lipoprotein n=1 Tax=Myxococcus llanfairpwllgwyngyllgogerychwyrndrobwllllantysiliogogogochensis TaxID=2590453 RepID=A0A540X3J5_9BACT|nr:hypothetical protein [Myxococcus llanfairpwllgwyngyllgogerychwyrndrobwllllantysiliogogogochensis]TQF15254.1 hypothetical protein FJV41_14335 [Myxococcus llanfairpwllgwyngyllgogerychwyrndrobwllllantysiliogogogochensis]